MLGRSQKPCWLQGAVSIRCCLLEGRLWLELSTEGDGGGRSGRGLGGALLAGESEELIVDSR